MGIFIVLKLVTGNSKNTFIENKKLFMSHLAVSMVIMTKEFIK